MKSSFFGQRKTIIKEKIKEATMSIAPIIVIVVLLCLTITPVPTDLLLAFIIGAILIIIGVGLFSLGAETSMTPIGTRMGTTLTKTKKLPLILLISFIVGVSITIAEPDLQVLAQTVPHIDNLVLLITVGVGVGLFLVICMLRIVLGIKLKWLLMFFYGLIFILAAFTDKDFLSIAFDSGGVTTGPMTVPFILALGVGVANIRSDKHAESDSFGLVALCSIGPILSVLILGLFYKGETSNVEIVVNSWASTADVGNAYLSALPHYFLEMLIALLPIVVLFLLFQVLSFHMSMRNFLKICLGLVYTYLGLVLFLTGVNVGFSSLATVLGSELANGWMRFLLIPLSMLLGWFIISAEPAVQVLEKQIEEVSSGAIPQKAIKYSLAIAIALAMGFSMIRVITGISILWFLIPGYTIALVLTFFVPDIFTAIAFDSGGVASGPMTATFMLQFVIGTSIALGGNILQDAFGLVAMVAMMPLITIQILGVIYKGRQVHAKVTTTDDFEIFELWEV